MNDILGLAIAVSGGGVLGLLHFGGLWWTLRRALASPRPALWVGASLLLRMACVAGGFVVVSAGDWRKALACLLGFWAARWLVLRTTARLQGRVAQAMDTAAPRPRMPLEAARGPLDEDRGHPADGEAGAA